MRLSRRELLGLAGLGVIGHGLDIGGPGLRAQDLSRGEDDMNFNIRTITAGVTLEGPDDMGTLESAMDFLNLARERYAGAGYNVQSVRLATQPLPEYLPDWKTSTAVEALRRFDQFAADNRVGFSIGQLLTDDRHDADFAEWVVTLINETNRLSMTTLAASGEHGIHDATIRATAEAISGIAAGSQGGEGNFRFAATAWCPPGTPFFPAAWHRGPEQFALGLETPNLLRDVFLESDGFDQARERLLSAMNGILTPLEEIATELAEESGRVYTGIDTSPAPSIGASIGEAIEALLGGPFGTGNTLSACAMITDVLQGVDARTCGYSGLMLPVMEDPVLAKRAGEGHFTVSELLLYSSVCGTGLDTVPLAGDVPVEALAAVIRNMAALAQKYQKALSARLFPVPGASVGQLVEFESPMLTDSVIMAID